MYILDVISCNHQLRDNFPKYIFLFVKTYNLNTFFPDEIELKHLIFKAYIQPNPILDFGSKTKTDDFDKIGSKKKATENNLRNHAGSLVELLLNHDYYFLHLNKISVIF